MSTDSRPRRTLAVPATLLLSVAIGYGAVLALRLHFMVVDDALLAQIAAGAYGEAAAPFLLFPNIILGWFLAGLYSVVPGAPWYAIVMVGLQCAAFWHLYVVVLGSGARPCCLVPLALAQLLSSVLLTYTVVAAVLTAAGAAGAAIRSRRPGGRRSLVASALLLFAGYLVRPPSFVVALAVCLPLMALPLFRSGSRARLLIALAAALVACVPAAMVNGWAYSQNPHDADSLARQDDSRRMVDYAPVDYGAHTSELVAMGWSRNDLDCYYDWVFADFDVYSVGNLGRLGKIPTLAERYELDPLRVARGLVARPMLFAVLSILLCAAASALFGRYGLIGRTAFAEVLVVCLMALTALAALVVRQRAVANAIAAVELPFLMAFLSTLAAARAPEGVSGNRAHTSPGWTRARVPVLAAACLSLALACSAVFAARSVPRPGAGDLSLDRAVDGWMAAHPRQLVATGSGFQFMRSVPAFEVSVPERFLQTVKVGSWSIDGRRWWYQLSKWGVDPRHLLLEMAERDDIVFMPDDSRQLKLVETFVREHSGRDVTSERVAGLPEGRALYRLTLR